MGKTLLKIARCYFAQMEINVPCKLEGRKIFIGDTVSYTLSSSTVYCDVIDSLPAVAEAYIYLAGITRKAGV